MSGRHRKPVTRRYKRALNRFTLLAAGWAIALSILGWQVHEAGWAHAATTHTREVWGSNVRTFPAYVKAVPQAHGVRIYYDTYDKFPATCPRQAAGVWELISLRPSYDALMSGSEDAQLRALAKTCPAHTDWTIEHENVTGNNPLGYPPSIHNKAHFLAMQAHMEALVQGTPVKFGVIGCGPVGGYVGWLAKGLDWYGFDMYFNSKYLTAGGQVAIASPFATASGQVSKALVWKRLDGNLAAIRQASGQKYPRIDIGETNASPDSRRIAWFTDLASWFDSHDGHRTVRIDTFWAGKPASSGGLSGPWPPSAGVIAVLKHLAWSHQ